MLGKTVITECLCPVFLEAGKELLFYLFGGRKVLRIVLLCPYVTKVVWETLGVRVLIWHKGTSSGPLYVQGICWASQHPWDSTKCYTTGMVQKTLSVGGRWHFPWHQKRFHKQQPISPPCQKLELQTPSVVWPTSGSVKWLSEYSSVSVCLSLSQTLCLECNYEMYNLGALWNQPF